MSSDYNLEVALSDYSEEPEMQDAVRRIFHFVSNVVPTLLEGGRRSRQAAAYDFGKSLRGSTEEQWLDLNLEMEEALGIGIGMPPEYDDILTGWDMTMPIENPSLDGLILQVRDLANTVASLPDISTIQDAIEASSPSFHTNGLPEELELQLRFHFEFNLPDEPMFAQARTLFWPYNLSDFGGFPERSLPAEMWDRVRRVRPGIRFFQPPAPEPTIVPAYFEPSLAFEPESETQDSMSSYGPEIEASALLNEVVDLITIKEAFKSILLQLMHILEDECYTAPEANPARTTMQDLLMSTHVMLYKAYEDGEGSNVLPDMLQGTPAILAFVAKVEPILGKVREAIVQAERFVITLELLRLTTDKKFKAYALRFERAKIRKYFARIIGGLKTERLKQVDYKTDVLCRWDPADPAALPVRPFDESDSMCAVCYEDFALEDGEIALPPVVTKCCKKPFDVDCLLPWLLEKIPKLQQYRVPPMTCPMCRTDIDLEFFGEMLEMKTRELGNL